MCRLSSLPSDFPCDTTVKISHFLMSNKLHQYLRVWGPHSWRRLHAVRRHATAASRPCVAWAMLQHRGDRSWPWAVWQERSWAVKRRWMLLHQGRRWWGHHGWLWGGRMVNGWWGWRSQWWVNDYWLLLGSIWTKAWRTYQETGRTNTSGTLLLALLLLLFVTVLLQAASADHSKHILTQLQCFSTTVVLNLTTLMDPCTLAFVTFRLY